MMKCEHRIYTLMYIGFCYFNINTHVSGVCSSIYPISVGFPESSSLRAIVWRAGNSSPPTSSTSGGGGGGGRKKQSNSGSGSSSTRHVTSRGGGKSESSHHHGGGSTKTTRIRTVLNEKQLHTLRTCYAANPRPDALMKDQLVEMTGLTSRVIRVWFQNKRCKDKKRTILIKQLQQQHHDKVRTDTSSRLCIKRLKG